MKDVELDKIIVFMEEIGYHFCDPELLFSALCHSSYANEQQQQGREKVISNERLEFLGDAVIDLIISELLYTHYPEAQEGLMARVKAAAASEEALSEIALEMKLNKYLFLGKGEEQTGGRRRSSILADVLEAIVAALYLDGGYSVSKELIEPYMLNLIEDVMKKKRIFDYKTALQELTQARFRELPQYEVVDIKGLPHARQFKVEVKIRGKTLATGEAPSIREAEKKAAQAAWNYFIEESGN